MSDPSSPSSDESSTITARLAILLDRVRDGDPDARGELLALFFDRLERLVSKIIRRSFPKLSQHDQSVVQETALRLLKALEVVHPPTLRDFVNFAAHKIRQVLLDIVAKLAREPVALSSEEQTTSDPLLLVQWSDFHALAQSLPEENREVFYLHYYLGLSHAEIAQLIGKHVKAVSRLWIEAKELLSDHLPDR